MLAIISGGVELSRETYRCRMRVRLPDHPWSNDHPNLTALPKRLETRTAFESIVPELRQSGTKVLEGMWLLKPIGSSTEF